MSRPTPRQAIAPNTSRIPDLIAMSTEVQCPPRRICRKVWVPQKEQRTINCVRYEQDTVVKEVPYTGTIRFHCGHDHSQLNPHHVGYVPQKYVAPKAANLLAGRALTRARREAWL